MPPVNHIHFTANGDSRQGSYISGNVQLMFPPHSYKIYPEISYNDYLIFLVIPQQLRDLCPEILICS